jgi:hypothetical protein
MMKIVTKVIDINPIIAERFLTKNVINRKLYESTVQKYALDMKRGRWGLNHQGICFDDEGNLIDGQNRLHAVIRSGKTIKFLVTYGIPSTFTIPNNSGDGGYETCKTQLIIDGGKMRSTGDQLHLNFGIKNANLKAAITRAIIEICQGRTGGTAHSTQTIKDIYDRYTPEIEAIAARRKSIPGLTVAGALGAMAFAAKPFREDALAFAEQYFTGVGLTQDSPVLSYRNFMLNRIKGQGLRAANKRRSYHTV